MEKVFLSLLNMSITAGWLVLAVILVRFILKKTPKYLRCLLWIPVGIRLVCPFTVESVISLIPSAETVPEAIIYAESPAINSGIPLINYAVNPVISQSLAPSAGSSATPMRIIASVAAAVWLAGMAVMLLYMLLSYLKIRRRVREAVRLDGNVWQCDGIGTPFILGVIRPRIYLPTVLSAGDADCVLAHENAHLKRRDHLLKPLAFLLLTVYWFNPLLWVAYVLLCRDIELACDEKVLGEYGAEIKKPYSAALINCGAPGNPVAACPLAFGEVGVKSRIKNVLSYKKPALWVIITTVAVCIVLGACTLTNPPESLNEWLAIRGGQNSDTLTFSFTGVSCYSVKTVTADDGEYIGDGLISYDGSMGKYRVLLVFGDALADDARWLDTYPAGKAVRLNDRLTIKSACPDDSSLYVYLGSDVPLEVDGKDNAKPGAGGRITVTVGYGSAPPVTGGDGGTATPDTDYSGEMSADMYYGLSDFKGLELYVWKFGSQDYSFALMSGTNRIKTDVEILDQYPATLAEMKAILKTYDTLDSEIMLYPVQHPLSSYLWQPDDVEITNLLTALGLSRSVRMNSLYLAMFPDSKTKAELVSDAYSKVKPEADALNVRIPEPYEPYEATGAAVLYNAQHDTIWITFIQPSVTGNEKLYRFSLTYRRGADGKFTTDGAIEINLG